MMDDRDSNGTMATGEPVAAPLPLPAPEQTECEPAGRCPDEACTRPVPVGSYRPPFAAPDWLWPLLFTAGLVIGLTAILALRFLPSQVQLNEGDVARQNIRAAQRTSYISQLRTREARDKAVASVADVYEYDESLVQQQKARVAETCQTITDIRSTFTNTEAQKRDRLANLSGVSLTQRAISETLAVSNFGLQSVCTETVRIVEETMGVRLRQTALAEVRAKLPGRFSATTAAGPLLLGPEMAAAFIRANDVFNQAETMRRREDAAGAVAPVRFTVEKDEIVVREGNVVTAFDLERLEALGLRNASTDWPEVLGRLLLVTALVTILALYLRTHNPRIWRGERRTVLLAALIIVVVAVARATVPGRAGLVYLFPFAAVPMIVTLLLGQHLALLVTVVLSLLIGPLADSSLEFTMISLISGTVGVLTLQRVERLSAFLWSGVFVALANYVTILAIHLPMGTMTGPCCSPWREPAWPTEPFPPAW